MNIKRIWIVLALLVSAITGVCQDTSLYIGTNGRIGIGTGNPQGALDIVSKKAGFLPPRMSSARISQIVPTRGMVVYDSSVNKLCIYNGSQWVYADGKSFAGSSQPGKEHSSTNREEDESMVYVYLAMGNDPAGNALINLKRATSPFIPPRMDDVEISQLKNQAAGTVVYNTSKHNPMYFDGKAWLFFNNALTPASAPVAKEIPKRSYDEIVDMKNPREGTTVFNTDEKKYVYYNGTGWVFDNGYKMTYKIGDTLDGGIVCYVNNGKPAGSHGLIGAQPRPAYYPLLIFPGSVSEQIVNQYTTSKQGISNENTKTLKSLKSATDLQKMIRLYAEKKVKRWLVFNGTERIETSISVEKFDEAYFSENETDRKAANIFNIIDEISASAEDNDPKWYIPGVKELLKISEQSNNILMKKDDIYLSGTITWTKDPSGYFFRGLRKYGFPDCDCEGDPFAINYYFPTQFAVRNGNEVEMHYSNEEKLAEIKKGKVILVKFF